MSEHQTSKCWKGLYKATMCFPIRFWKHFEQHLRALKLDLLLGLPHTSVPPACGSRARIFNCAKIPVFQKEFPLAESTEVTVNVLKPPGELLYVQGWNSDKKKSMLRWMHLINLWLENHLKEQLEATYHLHQYPLHTHLLLHCCQCRFDQGCDCRGSCHSGHQHHLCRSRTAVGCRWRDSCPARARKKSSFKKSQVKALTRFCLCLYCYMKGRATVKTGMLLSKNIPLLAWV